MQQVFQQSPTQTTATPQSINTPSPPNHGFQENHISRSASQLHSPSSRSPSVISDAASGVAGEAWVGGIDIESFNERVRGLNVVDRSPGAQHRALGQRVSDHENAYSPVVATPRRRVGFQVIQRVGDAPSDGPNIADFPNGERQVNAHPASWGFDY